MGMRAGGLKRDDDRVGFVVSCCARDRIDAHANQATSNYVAGEARRASPLNLPCQWNDLRLESRLLDGHGNIGVALHDNRTRRYAGRRIFKPGNDSFSAGRR
jgi:hypothetical protein